MKLLIDAKTLFKPGLGDQEFCFYKFSKNKILLL